MIAYTIPNSSRYAMPCIICGDSVELTENESYSVRQGHIISPKVCDKCKAAVMKIRGESNDQP